MSPAAHCISSSSRRYSAPARVQAFTPRLSAHPVVDVEKWLKGKAERAALIGKYATNVQDHVAADGSKMIAITADVHDMAGMQAMMASPPPEVAAAMERHGVVPPMTTYLAK